MLEIMTWSASMGILSHQVPCGGVTPEPKFICGSLPDLNGLPSCEVWSIGSAGETCFERS